MSRFIFMRRKLILVIIGLSFLIGTPLFAQEQGYTLNLEELLKKAEESLKKVEGEIEQQEIAERNIDREAKVRECFEKGNEFYKQGKLKEAKEEWEKIIAIAGNPEIKAYIAESARRVEIAQLFSQVDDLWKEQDYKACQPLLDRILELDEGNQKAKRLLADLSERIVKREKEERLEKQARLYEQAKRLYDDGRFQGAALIFEEAIAVDENLKYAPLARDYINRCQKAIQEEERRQSQAKIDFLLNQANNLYNQEEYTQAKPLYQEILELDPKNSTVLKQIKLISEKMKEGQRRQLEAKAQPIYEQALRLHLAKDYPASLEKFKEIKSILPDYKKTEYYLKHIPEDIQRERQRQELERQRQLRKQQEFERKQQEQLEKERQKQLALEKKEQERKQREEHSRLEKEKKQKERLEKERLRKSKLARKEKIDSFYKEATSLYNQDQFNEAKALFNQTLSLDPNHQRAKNYLETKIPNRIKEIKKKEQERLEAEKEKLELEKRHALKKEIDSHYTKAISYYRDKSYNLAIQEFNKVLELNPEHKSAQDYLKKRIPAKIEAQKEAQRKAQ